MVEHQKSLAGVWCHRSRKIQSSRALSLPCMCRGNVSLVWIRLLQHTLLSFLATSFMCLFFFFYIFVAYRMVSFGSALCAPQCKENSSVQRSTLKTALMRSELVPR